MANGIFLPDGSFQAFRAADLGAELATRRNAGLSLGELEGWINLLPDPDPILRKRGDGAAVLAGLLADDQVTTALLGRKNRVLNCPHFTFRPGAQDGESPTPQAEKLHRCFMADLERANLRGIISGILDAPFYGFAPLELVWKQANNWWHLVDIVARPAHWFGFDQQNNPVFLGNWGGLCATPQLLPAGKFVMVTHHASYDNPYGLRLLSRCLWPVAFKRGGLQFYSRFVERHGMPWIVGEAPKGADRPEKRDMAANLASMVQDAVAVIPQGAKVEFLTAGPTLGALHEAFLARQDKAISKLLMGQTLTVEMEGENSLAAAETHKGVAEELADADKAMVADTWNEIAWLYAQVNAEPGVLAPLAGYEEPDDLNTRADLDKKLVDMGVEFTQEHFTDNYGLKPTEFRVRTPAAPGLNFSAPLNAQPLAVQAQRNLDAAMEKLLPDALKANAAFVSQVENAIGSATSLDDVQLALVELLAPRMKPDALESFLARSMVMAAGFGAASVQAANADGEES